jgi:LytS/YehU family sensor histidine kinase
MFLFETLDRIHALYRGNVGEASRMLEDLIVYLRAALPHLRESTSTVEKEATLVRSWLDIVGRSAPDWQFEFKLAEAVRDARLPALVLLPLVQRAVAEAGPGGLRLSVTAQAVAGRLRLDVWTSTAAFAGGITGQPMLEQIDERLRALHGTEARFEAVASVGGAGSEAHIELPLESAPAIDGDERGGGDPP